MALDLALEREPDFAEELKMSSRRDQFMQFSEKDPQQKATYFMLDGKPYTGAYHKDFKKNQFWTGIRFTESSRRLTVKTKAVVVDDVVEEMEEQPRELRTYENFFTDESFVQGQIINGLDADGNFSLGGMTNQNRVGIQLPFTGSQRDFVNRGVQPNWYPPLPRNVQNQPIVGTGGFLNPTDFQQFGNLNADGQRTLLPTGFSAIARARQGADTGRIAMFRNLINDVENQIALKLRSNSELGFIPRDETAVWNFYNRFARVRGEANKLMQQGNYEQALQYLRNEVLPTATQLDDAIADYYHEMMGGSEDDDDEDEDGLILPNIVVEQPPIPPIEENEPFVDIEAQQSADTAPTAPATPEPEPENLPPASSRGRARGEAFSSRDPKPPPARDVSDEVREFWSNNMKGTSGFSRFQKLVNASDDKLSFREILPYVPFGNLSNPSDMRDRLIENDGMARNIYSRFGEDTRVLKVQRFMNVGASMKSRSRVVEAWIQEDTAKQESGAQTQQLSRQPSQANREELRRRRRT